MRTSPKTRKSSPPMNSKEVRRPQTERQRRSASSSRSFRKSASFAFSDEFAAITRRVEEEVQLSDSEIAFRGYGIVAPEYNWNDYEGLGVRGKTVVALVNGRRMPRRILCAVEGWLHLETARKIVTWPLRRMWDVTRATNSSLQSVLLSASFWP